MQKIISLAYRIQGIARREHYTEEERNLRYAQTTKTVPFQCSK